MNPRDYLSWLYEARTEFYNNHSEYQKISEGNFYFDEEHYRHTWFAKFDEEIKKIESILWGNRDIKCLPCTHFVKDVKKRKKVLA